MIVDDPDRSVAIAGRGRRYCRGIDRSECGPDDCRATKLVGTKLKKGDSAPRTVIFGTIIFIFLRQDSAATRWWLRPPSNWAAGTQVPAAILLDEDIGTVSRPYRSEFIAAMKPDIVVRAILGRDSYRRDRLPRRQMVRGRNIGRNLIHATAFLRDWSIGPCDRSGLARCAGQSICSARAICSEASKAAYSGPDLAIFDHGGDSAEGRY